MSNATPRYSDEDTVKLAYVAMRDYVLDGADYDAIEGRPACAYEMTEFVRWLARTSATKAFHTV